MQFLKLRNLGALIFASVALLAASPAQATPLDCERILTEAETLAKHIDDSTAEVQRLFAHYEEQARNWREFLSSNSPLAKYNIHVLHQTAIKELNEKIWNMTGTEEYLETFHDLLHQYLKTNPALGAVLHNDYKNHFIASPLDPKSFHDLVLEPVLARLIRHMQSKRPDFDWATWIPATIFHGEGKTPAEAYFRAGLARSKFTPDAAQLSVPEWQAQATARRGRLMLFAVDKGIDWSMMLGLIHKNIGRGVMPETIVERWLHEHGDVDGAIFNDMRRYYDDLQIGDFYPLPDPGLIPSTLEDFVAAKASDPFKGQRSNWTVERRTLFTMVKDARYIVATDVQNLGGVARRFQDEWIARGARLEELQAVYAKSTAALETFFSLVHQLLTAATGGPVQVYWSGDDAVWFLPKLTKLQQRSVRKIFLTLAETGDVEDSIELKLHRSTAVAIDPSKPVAEGVAAALMSARDSLFASKNKHKAAAKP